MEDGGGQWAERKQWLGSGRGMESKQEEISGSSGCLRGWHSRVSDKPGEERERTRFLPLTVGLMGEPILGGMDPDCPDWKSGCKRGRAPTQSTGQAAARLIGRARTFWGFTAGLAGEGKNAGILQ